MDAQRSVRLRLIVFKNNANEKFYVKSDQEKIKIFVGNMNFGITITLTESNVHLFIFKKGIYPHKNEDFR